MSPEHERRSVEHARPPTVVMQSFDDMTPKQKNVLFYWALGLITVPAFALLLMFVTPVVVTWPVVVVFSLPIFCGLFFLAPGAAVWILDMVLKRIAKIVPKIGAKIHRDRRNGE